MAVYDYACAPCGVVFTATRPMAEYQEPHDCPSCGGSAPRVMVTAPRLGDMGGSRRSAPAMPGPSTGHVHGSGCGCGGGLGSRPWMVSN